MGEMIYRAVSVIMGSCRMRELHVMGLRDVLLLLQRMLDLQAAFRDRKYEERSAEAAIKGGLCQRVIQTLWSTQITRS